MAGSGTCEMGNTIQHISQSKKRKGGGGANKNGVETEIKGGVLEAGALKSLSPPPPPPPIHTHSGASAN